MVICGCLLVDVNEPTGNAADYKHAAAEDLGRMGLVARVEDIFYGSPMGRGSDRTTMAVVAEINDDADRFLRSVVSGRPLSRSVMQTAANFGAIPMRDGSTQSRSSQSSSSRSTVMRTACSPSSNPLC